MLQDSLRLGRIAGVRVGVNISVLVIVVILVFGLAVGRFPAAFPGHGIASYIAAATVSALLFLLSLLTHELAHAIVARRNGLEVDGITLWLFGGVARLRGDAASPGADFRIAAVGPLTSLVVGAVLGSLAALAAGIFGVGLITGMLGYLAGVNVLLAIFNLVPAAPLDGGRVLRAIVWRYSNDRTHAAITAARAGRIFGVLLIATGVLQVVLGGGFGGFWLVLIGLFLVNAAAAEEQHAQMNAQLNGVRVADIMSRQPTVTHADEPLRRFIDETVLTHRFSTYPLVDSAGRFSGLATLNRVRAVPPGERNTTTLGDVACSPDEVPVAAPEDALTDLLPRMNGCADGRAVVLDSDGAVVGLVTATDISRALQVSDLRPLDPYPTQRGADLTSSSRAGFGA